MRKGDEAPAAPALARETVALIQRGVWSADDLARSTLDRIVRVDPTLGAFVCTLRPEAAAEQARRLRGPLAGLPVAVKDIFDTRELPTAYGSTVYGHGPALTDAAIVSVLHGAGGLAIGKTTTTEFAFLQPTATRNLRAPDRTPGGSSAGSAAAVAAGLVPLALGTQTAGSVIRPASYCGVVGYKPSFGWLPTAGLKCFSWSLDTVGLFSRDVADAAWFAQALTGRALSLDAGRAPSGGVVGVPDAYPWGEASPSARRAVALGRQALQAAGVETRPCTLPPAVAAAFEAQAVIQGYEASRCLRREFNDHRDALSPLLCDYLQGAVGITSHAYEDAQRIATQARSEVAAWFSGFDALLLPSAPDEAPLGHASTGPSTFNRAWTLLGGPCINVPGAVGDHGAPMGLQLVAPFGADACLLQLAARLEYGLGTQLASPSAPAPLS